MKLLLLFILISSNVIAANAREIRDRKYAYKHERQIFDLWTPKSEKKTPLVIYIHAGGFTQGDKSALEKQTGLKELYNKHGVAIATINYRFLEHAPLQTILHEDIAGFVQYIRRYSYKFNIDKEKIFAYGVSAGGSASLWLGTHEDLIDEDNVNLTKRESTRISGLAHMNSQVSYNMARWYDFFWKEDVDNYLAEQIWTRYGYKSKEEYENDNNAIEIRRDLDMIENITRDDPPMFFWNNMDNSKSVDYGHFVHHPRHAQMLYKRAIQEGVDAQILVKPEATSYYRGHFLVADFFLDLLNI